VGGAAPELSFSLLGGGEAHLDDHRGKVVLLDFWATWCPPCVKSLPVVHRVAQEFGEEDLVTFAVNRDDGRNREALVEAFLARHGIEGLDVALDDGTAAGTLGVRALPTLVLIDREGLVPSVHVGAMGEDDLRALLTRAVSP
jgi:thiol-disulfide isomerase/thioredoxin